MPSADLDRYLATLEARASARQFLLTFGDLLFAADSARLGDGQKDELRNYLVVQGIDPSRLTIVSRGADSPLLTNRTQSDRAGNRRVAIVVQKSPTEPVAAGAQGKPSS